MTVYTTLPTDDLNLAVTVVDDPDLVVLNINPAAVSGGGGGGSGTVTQVSTGTGLTGGPITTTGTIAIDTSSDITFNSVTADFFGVQHFTAKARETITAGQPVYISGHSGNTPEVMVADFDDPAKMPAFGIASADIANNNNGSISTFGDLKNVDTTGTNEGETWAVGDELFVNNNKLTNTRPTGSSEEVQKIAKIIRVHANNGQLFLMGAGRSNDVPNLATSNVFIGNGSGVEKRQLTYTDILNTPAGTTINNNANNRVITGSDIADTLEGEANFTWDGTNGLMSGTSSDYDSPILHLKTDTSGYNKTQLLFEDDNGKAFAQVGQVTNNQYQWNITLDPDNTHGRSGVTTYAGDYFVSFEKNYSTQSAIRMDMNVYGANDGFHIKVRDDFNSGGGNQYGHKPLVVDASEIIFKNSNGDEYAFPNADGTNGQAITTDGAGNLTFTTVSGGGGSSTLGGLSDVDIQNVQNNDLLMYNSTASEWQNTNLGLTVTPTITGASDITSLAEYTITVTNHNIYQDVAYFVEVYTGSTRVVENADVTKVDGVLTFTAPAGVGSHQIRLKAQDFGDLQSEQTTLGFTTTAFGGTFRYWKLTGVTCQQPNWWMLANMRLFDATSQGGNAYPANMTSDTAPTPYVTDTNNVYNASYPAWKAFDSNTVNTFYWAIGSSNGPADWLTVDLGSAVDIKSMTITAGNNAQYAPTGFELYASATGVFGGEETLVYTATGLPGVGGQVTNIA